MPALPVAKRQFHAFLSHAHVDRAIADRLDSWMRDIAGIEVWYDVRNLPPASTIEEVLPAAIESSRALILLMSRASLSRGWVQHEYRAAINHQTNYPGFRILPIALEDIEPPGFLQNYSCLRLHGEDLNDAADASAILGGLYQPTTTFDVARGRNVYLSRGWHADDIDLADTVSSALRDCGLQLIGDAEDQQSWVETRITSIMETCGGYAAVLPHRALGASATSKYILREWEIAESLGLPCFVVPDPRVALEPPSGRPGLLDIHQSGDLDAGRLAEGAASFADEWSTPVRSPFVFFATDFGLDRVRLRGMVRELVEAVTALPCVVGEYVEGAMVQREILRTVTKAALVLADVSGNSPNVYIEVGAARGADVPVFILRQGPPGRPAFMLRDQQVWDYRSEADLLGRVASIVRQYRRTIITPRRP